MLHVCSEPLLLSQAGIQGLCLSLNTPVLNIDERKKTLRFELRTGTYDKTKPYRLVLRDAESDAEVQSVQVVIDRSFDDDF